MANIFKQKSLIGAIFIGTFLAASFVPVLSNSAEANTFIPPVPAPPPLPEPPTPIPPTLPPPPPVAPPVIPPIIPLPPPLPTPPPLPPTPTPPPLPVPPPLPPTPTPPPIIPPVNPPPGPGNPPIPPAVPAAIPVLSIVTDASPVPLTSGVHNIAWNQNIQSLNWSSQNAVSCVGDGFNTQGAVSGTISSGNTSLIINPGSSKTFRLSCTNTAGVISPWTEVTITKGNQPVAPLPTVNLSIEVSGAPFPYGPAPTNYSIGSSQNLQKLTWSSNNAVLCEGDGFVTGGNLAGVINEPDPSLLINPGNSKVFRLRCQNSDSVWSGWVRIGFNKSNLPPPPPNQAPSNPVIRGADRFTSAPIVGEPNQVMTFTVFAVDPDGDNLYYEIDLDENGVVDIRLPGVGYVSSDTAQIFNRSWSSEGVYRFRARAIDSNNNRSGWTPHEIEIKNVVVVTPPPPVSITIVPDRSLIRHGQSTDLRIQTTADYEAVCTLRGPSTGVITFLHNGLSSVQNHSYNSGPLIASQRFEVTCSPAIPLVLPSTAETRVNVIPLVQEI